MTLIFCSSFLGTHLKSVLQHLFLILQTIQLAFASLQRIYFLFALIATNDAAKSFLNF